MNRRKFSSQLAGLGLVLPFVKATAPMPVALQKPEQLDKGDIIGLITPGSAIDSKGLEKAVKNIEGLKLKVKLGANVGAKRGFLAGTDQQRLDDLHAMFADDTIKAIWCIRGGYGCSRLLPSIDFDLIRNHPKILIGYSDITALHQAIHVETGLVTFHGPVASSDFTRYVKNEIESVLFKSKSNLEIAPAKDHEKEAKKNKTYQTQVISAGKAKGVLAGGNLTLLAALSGTRHALDATDKIIFLEDVGEKPYRIDRMLTQLRQSAHLHRARGILLGIFEDCEATPNDENSLSLQEVFQDRLGDLGIPVLYGLSFGHITEQCILPIGVEAAMDTSSTTIQLLEKPIR